MQYPITFRAEAKAVPGIQTEWSIQSGKSSAACTVPVEFGGPGSRFSPEDLFAQALVNCFVGTFKVMAELSKLQYETLLVSGDLVMDKNEAGKPWMKAIQLFIRLANPSHPDRAKALVKKAVETGFILNSVKTAIEYDVVLE